MTVRARTKPSANSGTAMTTATNTAMNTALATTDKPNEGAPDTTTASAKSVPLRNRPIDTPPTVTAFTDRTGKPFVLFKEAKGRRVYPTDHAVVLAAVTQHLYTERGRIPPSDADIKSLHRVLVAQAVLLSVHQVDDCWTEYLLDQNPFVQAVYYLALDKCHRNPSAF